MTAFALPLASSFRSKYRPPARMEGATGKTPAAKLTEEQPAMKVSRTPAAFKALAKSEPDGSMFSVAEVAGKMISISDNTAADHLLRLVGRERVEAYLPSMGLASPAL